VSDPASATNGAMNGFIVHRSVRKFQSKFQRMLTLETGAAHGGTFLEFPTEVEAKLAELDNS
jgi:hypothetical protein